MVENKMKCIEKENWYLLAERKKVQKHEIIG